MLWVVTIKYSNVSNAMTRFRLKIAIVICMALIIYSVSFVALRKVIFLTGIASEGRTRGETVCIRVIYFSNNQTVNSCLYYLYYPVIFVGGGDVNIIEKEDDSLSIRSLEVNPRLATSQDPIYLHDITVLHDESVVISE